MARKGNWTTVFAKLNSRRFLQRWIDFDKQDMPPIWRTFNRFDAMIALAILIFTILFCLERLQGDFPHILLGGDAANIVSFALAKLHPEWFAGDFLLGDLQNFQLYFQFHVPYIFWLNQWLGNPALALLTLLPVSVLLYLWGLYWLGKVLFRHRLWAASLLLLNAIPMYLPVDDIGILPDPLPRHLFQALLVYLLALAILWKDKPSTWLLMAFAMGILVYFHAVSTPAWIAALFGGWIVCLPATWSWKQKLWFLFSLIVVLLITLFPFGFNYQQSLGQARELPSGVSYAEFMRVFTTYYNTPDLHNILPTTKTILVTLALVGLLPFGLTGFIIGGLLAGSRSKELLILVIWFAAIGLISVVLPALEKKIEAHFQLLPLQTELFRGVRFFRFLLSLIGLWGISLLVHRVRKPIPLAALFLAMVVIIVIRSYSNPRTLQFLQFPQTWQCLQKGQLICQEPSPLVEVMLFVRDHTPQGSPIFFTPSYQDTASLCVRYLANRPLVYSWKDRGLGFTRPDKFWEWYEVFQVFAKVKFPKKWLNSNPVDFIAYIKDLGARYLVLDCPCPELPPSLQQTMPVLYENSAYKVYALP